MIVLRTSYERFARFGIFGFHLKMNLKIMPQAYLNFANGKS